VFRRLLIANRGAIAARIADSCRALGITTVAPVCAVDGGAPFTVRVDRPVPVPDPPPNPYLDAAGLIALAQREDCDALHPGYGFLAEDAAFARAVADAGITFIGPTAEQIQRFGDKANARAALARAGLPVFIGSGALATLAAAEQWLEDQPLPVLLKPVAGGGGIGMQVVNDRADLPAAFERAQALAGAAFSDPRVLLEQYVAAGRHIELQLLASRSGAVMHAWERDCSVQRRRQKIIEEAPAPGIERSEIGTLAETAVGAFAELGYSNIGTLELLRGADGQYGVLEVNTRIQVEHAVTEAITGLDLVAQQLALAAGAELPGAVVPSGHAIEARLYAEDPATGFPATGSLERLDWPRLEGLRIEPGAAQGQRIGPHFDPLLGKLISSAHTRDRAIGQLRVALKALVVEGVATNQRQLLAIVESDDFAAGTWHTQRLEAQPLMALVS
jgi:acetyl/propionyl-CoA carboxylase alpha subunit